MAVPLTLETSAWSSNRTEQETNDFIAVWGKAQMQWKFHWDIQSTVYKYEEVVAHIQESSPQQSG